MEKEKVSIITAVYKVEEFLKRCVDSILKQTYQNLELLLIDDGSPDNCPKMCDDLAKKDARIKVIHKENGGVSSAWNAGLDNATGDYIAFVDSDDWVEPDYIAKLYETLQKYHSDIAICCNDIFCNSQIREDETITARVESFYPAKECIKAFLAKDRWRHTTWGKLYKKAIFATMRYPEDIKCVEDSYMICDLCRQVKNGIATTDKILYHYVIQNNSVSRTISAKRFDWIRAKRHILDQLNPKDEVYIYAVEDIFIAYKSTYHLFKSGKRKDLIKQLNAWLKEDYKEYIKYTKGAARLKNFVFRYFRPVFNFLYMLKHK